MDWTDAFVLMIFLIGFLFWVLTLLDKEIKECNLRLDAQMKRTDHLYQIVMEIIRESKSKDNK
jgi:hypothetical protein